VLVQLEDEDGRVEEMSREAAILVAFRRLVARGRYVRPSVSEDDFD
jgi:hypothetical protein